MKSYNVAIVGATGMVGRTFIQILEERDFPINELRPLASAKSVGQGIMYRGEKRTVGLLEPASFKNIDFALFSAGADISKQFSPIAAESGAVVIDNSSAFRMQDNIPLVVPEVNAEVLQSHHRIIANPNCSTIQMVVAAKPIHDAASIQRIVVSTYQAVSGKGKDAVDELESQSQSMLQSQAANAQVFPHQIAFNALPHIDIFKEDGNTAEEIKMIQETRKIMGEPDLAISAMCVRVPVFNGHSLSLNLELEKPLTVDDLRNILANAPGIELLDNPNTNLYPTPVQASGKDDVFVGRIRRDDSVENGFNLWVVSDNLRKGAALNAIQIAEQIIKKEAL
ncbi:MAG: aspartate-semialdehyde dehydrogenase [bacterium]